MVIVGDVTFMGVGVMVSGVIIGVVGLSGVRVRCVGVVCVVKFGGVITSGVLISSDFWCY